MRFGEFQFRFRPVPFLLLALPVPLFAALGLWQLDRAEEKRMQLETLLQREQLPPLPVQALERDADALRYRKIRARGRYLEQQQFFIENRLHGHRTGFHVITPLRLEGSGVELLVNRGWLEAGPGNSIPAAPVPVGPLQVEGTATVALPPALVLSSGQDTARGWGNRWPYMTTELYAAMTAAPVQPFVLLLDPDQPDGFLRQWPRELPKEGMHLGYAIQWFSFAAIALGFYLKLSLARPEATT
jgi:surfeit locus 1 family protein